MAPISRPPLQSSHAAQFFDLAQIDHNVGRLMRSFSQSKVSRPPAITHASDPYWASKRQRVFSRGRLKEFECRHDVANDSHMFS